MVAIRYEKTHASKQKFAYTMHAHALVTKKVVT